MEQKSDRLYPSAPSQNNNIELEQRKKKLNDLNSLKSSIDERIHKSNKTYKKYGIITTILKSVDSIVIIATKSGSIPVFFTGNSLIVIPISTGKSCGLTIGNKVIYEIKMEKHIQYRKQNQKDQQTNKPFYNL